MVIYVCIYTVGFCIKNILRDQRNTTSVSPGYLNNRVSGTDAVRTLSLLLLTKVLCLTELQLTGFPFILYLPHTFHPFNGTLEEDDFPELNTH